jgi:outer membrane immunogenic protein
MRIKTILLGSVAGAMLAAPAFAADLSYPVKAPIIAVAPMFSWTGFYLGANAGYGWGEGSANWGDYLDYYYSGWNSSYDGGTDPDGWFGGVQVGYNFQLQNNLVLGIEADAQFGSMKDTLNYSASDPITGASDVGTITSKIESFGTIRGRIGYAADRFLPYVTGGLAWGNVKVNEDWTSTLGGVVQPGLSGSASVSETIWGWTLGGGVEYAVTDNWTVKGEYLYTDLGDISWDGDASTDIGVKLQTLKVGVNYKF